MLIKGKKRKTLRRSTDLVSYEQGLELDVAWGLQGEEINDARDAK